MADNGRTREELLGEVEELRRRLAAAEQDHQIVVAGLRDEQRLAEAQWRRRVTLLERERDAAHPPRSGSPDGKGPIEDAGEQQQLLVTIQNQAEELQAANEELGVQTEELQAANEELTIQTEELRISNEELAAQAMVLEEQKQDLEHLAGELKAERALLTSVLEQMPASVMIAGAPEGPVLLSNHLAKKLWDEPLQGLADLDIYWGLPCYYPDDRACRKEDMPLWRSLTLGEVVMHEEITLRPEGRPPLHLSVSSAPVRDGQGRIVAGVVTHTDITARKAAEAKIRHLASFPQLNPNPVLELDLTGAVTYYNQAAHLALKPLGEAAKPEAFFPEDLKDILIAVRDQGKRRFYREVRLKDAVYALDISYAEPFQVIRLYARDITERQQAEKALLESRQDLKRAQAIGKIGSWRLDVQRNELIWSDETYRIFGIPQGTSLTYEAFLATVHPEDREYIDREWTAALGGEPYDIQHRILVGDELKWLREKAELEFNPQGRLLGGFGTVQDITERKQIEGAWRESEERLRLAQQVARIGTFEWNVQTGENTWTEELEALYGLPPGNFARTQTAWEDLVHPEDRSDAIRLVEAAFETGEPMEGEWRVIWPDGSVHWLAGRWQVLKDESGKPLRMTGINSDITARKEAEEALQRAHDDLEQRVKERTAELRNTVAQLIEEVQERQQAEMAIRKQADLLELAHEAILVRDLDSRVIFWNRGAEETYGWTREQAAGRVSHDLLKTRFPIAWEELEQNLLQAGQWQGELVHITAGGEEIVVASRMALQRDDQGQPVAILEINRDVTARRRAEEALETERQRLFAVLERIPAHVALLRADHTFAYVNGEFIRRFGEPDSRRCYEVIGQRNPCEECQAMAVFRTGQPVVWEWAGKDNNFYQIFDYPFMDVDGSPLVLEMGVDITARKQAEKALENERQRLFSVLERIPAYVALISPECTVPYANREFIKRFGDPGNRRCYEFLFGLDEPCEGCKALEVFKTKAPALWEWSGPDGNTYQIYDYPFNDVDGSPLILEMGVDVSARKQAEEQTKSLTRMYRMLSKANEAIVRASGKEELFRRICRIMMEEGDFLLAWIGMVDPKARLIRSAAQYDLMDRYLQNITITLDDAPEGLGPSGTAAREGRSDVCNDIAGDPRMAPWREAALSRGFRSSAAFPLRVGPEVVGVLSVYAGKPGFFTVEEIALLESLADDLSFALEFLASDAQRRLVEEVLRESEDRLRYLASQLLQAQEKERRHVAIELHDDLGQSLMVLKMQLRAIEKTVPPEHWRTREECAHSLAYLNGVVDNVRRISRNLRPSVLEDLGLSAGLRVLAEEFRKYHEVELSMEMDDIEGLFSRDEEINLYRIFQETLTNIAKHSEAKRVSLVIVRLAHGVSFKVTDDGVGFDLEQVLARDGAKKGLGLAALEERMRILGGALTIKAQERQGTEISFTVPYPSSAR